MSLVSIQFYHSHAVYVIEFAALVLAAPKRRPTKARYKHGLAQCSVHGYQVHKISARTRRDSCILRPYLHVVIKTLVSRHTAPGGQVRRMCSTS
eukprot:SAG22_NODE_869_length_6749_cov_3.048120_8_plen_94_part_00